MLPLRKRQRENLIIEVSSYSFTALKPGVIMEREALGDSDWSEEGFHELLIPRNSSPSSLGSVGLTFYKVFNGPCIVSSLQAEVQEGSSVSFQISRSRFGAFDKVKFARQTRQALVARGSRGAHMGRGALTSVGMTCAKVEHPGPFIVTSMERSGTAFSSGLVRVGQILHEVEGRSTSVMNLEELDSLLLGRPGSLVHLVLSSHALDVSGNQNYIESQVIFRNQQGNVGMELWKGLHDVFEVLSVQPEVKGPADTARLQAGDVIHAVNDMRSQSPPLSHLLNPMIRPQRPSAE
ncbi:hypothetical protein GUITHDRAFT_112510 [Guillardia theta CCMP2712]|uniref:PDZ domain-containing protein n=1 Tax=Guillardia theta (strain CCMP2712) TaxID=905079 RepID=L1IZL9_GUITC|nr:hypothetical protein GUITHDRAFT_112510 [Guillardia theta CCMP2712]EKX41537.1 hypothetical protein GUITHDRAFT_112510 [Guillardia theta CCMP2712]|eukprot:XP_005828517.1 hypothetical protein GUITHDRAFT_112510 [Guillardia theta CCMP2712]